MPELDLATDRVYGDDASPQRQTTPQPDHGIALPNRESYKVAREMLQAGTPFEEVVEMFAEVFGPQELMRVMQETEAREAEVEGGAEGRLLVRHESSPSQHEHPASDEWESYDEDEWHYAKEDAILDEAPGAPEAPVPAPSTHTETSTDSPAKENVEPSVPISQATFVRALKDSDPGSKPYFRPGDVLRIIGVRRRGDLYFELLPLKPPGEAGRALRGDFQVADQAAVDRVGKEAGTDKERDCFRCAVEWED